MPAPRPLLLAVTLLAGATLAGGALATTTAQAQPAPQSMHHHPSAPAGLTAGKAPPTQPGPTAPGQSAFAAIQEIVEILRADRATDWSRVNMEALRQHLIDMDNVTLHATTSAEPVPGGMRFTVTGEGPIRTSIRRMVLAHAATMNGAPISSAGPWRFTATETPDGASLTVLVPARDQPMLAGLGFIGVLTAGMHHQQHHLMLAKGGNPHN